MTNFAVILQQQIPLTGEVVRTLPDIIKAASQSSLGVVSLAIIVAAGATAYLLRTAKPAVRLTAVIALLVGVGGYVLAAIAFTKPPVPSNFSARVLDSITKSPVDRAKVMLDIEGPPPYTFTDSDGVFSFWLRLSGNAPQGRLTVERDGYQPYNRIVFAQGFVKLQDVLLSPTGGQQASASQTIGAARPTESETHPSADVQRPAPRGPVPPATSTREVRSGPQLSGSGAGWSQWYQVSSEPAPPGYVVADVEFWLSGDRQCNAWAECQQVVRNDLDVIYQFRLQGHNEWAPPGQAFSEGHLRVTYRLKN